MDFEVNVYHHLDTKESLVLLKELNRKMEIVMGLAQDVLTQLNNALTSLAGIQGDIANLEQQIADLVAAGAGATPAEMQELLTAATALSTAMATTDADRP